MIFVTLRYALQTSQMCIRDRTNTELYRLALSTYGAEAQTMMVMEEMSELQKELCKHARGKDNQLSIAEEIADVLIMLDQMMILHDCESIVAQYKQEKLERLEERLKPVSYTHLAYLGFEIGSSLGGILSDRKTKTTHIQNVERF